MTVNKLKIRCPRCNTVYSIDNCQINVVTKKTAKCTVCESRFFVENREGFGNPGDSMGNVTFLQSYFEKRGGTTRRGTIDRRKDFVADELYIKEFPHDVIPIFDSEGNGIIGHISPGRRKGIDRRSGIDRRQSLMDQDMAGNDLFTISGPETHAMQADN